MTSSIHTRMHCGSGYSRQLVAFFDEKRFQDGLICDRCKLLYEIRDDIPVMLIDEAKKID